MYNYLTTVRENPVTCEVILGQMLTLRSNLTVVLNNKECYEQKESVIFTQTSHPHVYMHKLIKKSKSIHLFI